MSANNEIVIKKEKGKWKVYHNDLDCNNMDFVGEADTLEEAVDRANEFEKECEFNLFGVEYGIRIIKGRNVK